MAPLEEMRSRDLAWISDFVMEQMVLMLRPMMDHLQETDVACDYAQRLVQRVSMDVSEVRLDLERTNKYLAILRQGMGVQNEGRCMLQRSLETTTRTVQRLDDQMESMHLAMSGIEDSKDLAKQVSASSVTMEELQARVEVLAGETLIVKDGLLSNEARLEVSQRELRELRRGQLGVAPKLDDKGVRAPPSSQSGRAAAVDQAPWPQRKTLAAAVEPLGTNVGGTTPGYNAANNFSDTGSLSRSGSRQEKRVSPGLRLQQTCPVGLGGLGGLHASSSVDESNAAASRLPLLSSSRAIGSSSAEPGNRLRFTATMSKPESRGKLS